MIQIKHIKWGMYLILISSALFINTVMIFIVPRVEKYSQAALIEFLESKKKKENFDLKFCLICKNLISVVFCPHCKQSTSFTDTCDFCDGSLEKVKVCKKCIFESDMGLLELDGREVVCLFCGKIFSSGLVECPDCDKADV